MRIIAERAELKALLAMHGRIVEKRVTIPILANARFEVEDGRLSVTSTSLDRQLRGSIDVQTEGDAAFTAPLHALQAAVEHLPEGCQVTFELDADAGAPPLRVRGGRANYKFHTLPVEDFPPMEGLGRPTKRGAAEPVAVPPDVVAFLLHTPREAVSTEEARFYLNGIFLEPVADGEADGPALYATATNGHWLARARAALPDGVGAFPAVIAPRQSLPPMAELLRGAPSATMRWSDKLLELAVPGYTFTTKLVDGTFPDYRRTIPEGADYRFRAASKTILEALGRIAVVGGDGNAVKIEPDPDGTGLKLSGHGDQGDADEIVDVEHVEGTFGFHVGFNRRYLGPALALGERPEIGFNHPGESENAAASLITFPDAEGRTEIEIVIMPMRV